VYDTIDALTSKLISNLPRTVSANRVGSMFTVFLQPGPVTDFASAKKSDTARFSRFFHHLLDRNIYFPPSQFEAGFMSAAHTEQQIAKTAAAIHDFLDCDIRSGA
jgi:glutamate-1-semialdehyde 2,1-aminomutase